MIPLLILSLFAQSVIDLGVMTPNRAIMLEKCTNRADFLHFTVELKALRWPSNYATFKTTNDVLKMDDFMAMPPGPCVMTIKSTCADGEESPLAAFKLDIRRNPPASPRARSIATGAPPSRQSLSNFFQSRRPNTILFPPTPGQTNEPAAQPLPGGKPETYSDGVIKMQQFYAEHNGRRNQ